MSRIMARWEGPDIADGNQDTLVLKIGQLLLAFLIISGIFGMALVVFGMEIIWSETKAGSSNLIRSKTEKI